MRHYVAALLSLILDFILILGITAMKTTPWDCLLLDDCTTALSSRCKHSQLKQQFFCGLQDSVFNMRHYFAALLPLILEFILIGITTFNGPAHC
jgi:hypothetical protein